MFLTNLFRFKKTCSHEKISPAVERGYCPDCGKLIENEWYITRCACCDVKLKTIAKNGEAIPQYQYCMNCGSTEFKVEKLKNIDFININFAVLIRREIDELKKAFTTTQCWQEKTNEQPKLLALFR